MMRVKFNKFERVAGIFVGVCFVAFLLFVASAAVKQGWFESKVMYHAIFQNADGVHTGTMVQIAGLKAGAVDEVELMGNNKIMVRFYVLSKFRDRIRQDSSAQFIRPFVIGERVLEVSVGSEESPVQLAESPMTAHETVDLMTLMSGKQLGEHLEIFSGMMENLRVLAEAFFDKERTRSFIKIFDRIDPLIKNMNTMALEVVKLSKQANKDERLGEVLAQAAVTTRELNRLLPEISENAPQLVQNTTELIGNLNVITKDFKVLLPALAAIAPDLPRTSRRAVEALDEAVVMMKAMQRSFFFKGNAQDVREEEKEKEKKRLPASENNQ